MCVRRLINPLNGEFGFTFSRCSNKIYLNVYTGTKESTPFGSQEKIKARDAETHTRTRGSKKKICFPTRNKEIKKYLFVNFLSEGLVV